MRSSRPRSASSRRPSATTRIRSKTRRSRSSPRAACRSAWIARSSGRSCPRTCRSWWPSTASRQAVERTVIDVQAHSIGRDKGIDYGVQDFLEGTKREKFQADFTQELIRVCREKNVTVHSAFIRNIVIPEAYLKPIRDKQIAAETEITNKAKEVTAESEADVEREQQMIPQRDRRSRGRDQAHRGRHRSRGREHRPPRPQAKSTSSRPTTRPRSPRSTAAAPS